MYEFFLPKMGDAMEEGVIVQWLKNVGDKVGPDDPVVEIETDKSNVEVPAGAEGFIQSISAKPGETIPVGQVIAIIGAEAPSAGQAATQPPPPVEKTAPQPVLTWPAGPNEVRVAFDNERLILAVICHDSEPDRLMANQMQRDQSFGADDRFRWTLDTFLTARGGYFFEINPAGAMGDGLLEPGGGSGGGDSIGAGINRSWDGIWIARVQRSSVGWTAEIEIPFRTLNFDPNAPAWGVNFQRTIRRREEETFIATCLEGDS